MRIIGIPFDAGSLGKNLGCAKAYDAIKAELASCFYSENKKEPKFEFSKLHVPNDNASEARRIIEQAVENEDSSIIIGGDHSITYSAFKGFAKRHSNPGLIVFDAHPDVMDDDTKTHEDYLSALINGGHLKKENVVLSAIRNWDKIESDYLEKNKIRNFSMKHIQEIGIEATCDAIMEFAQRFDALYISLDIDAVDPAFAPGTGYIEPAGLTSREMMYFIQRLRMMKNLKVVDIVEVNPDKDINNLTTKLAAKMIVEFLI